ncbi:MAG: hypothetical protein LC799_21930 [Actinobacteria bacterium]|nr:hypothetical protein [Actinomycetota bacterium]
MDTEYTGANRTIPLLTQVLARYDERQARATSSTPPHSRSTLELSASTSSSRGDVVRHGQQRGVMTRSPHLWAWPCIELSL